MTCVLSNSPQASLFAALALLGGCETFLPSAGPSADAVDAGVSTAGLPYAVVKLTPEVVDAVGEHAGGAIAATFGDRRPPPEIRFGVGDVVSITIFEANAGGLFIPPRPASGPAISSRLPIEPIDSDGRHIRALRRRRNARPARRVVRCKREIVNAIKNRAIEPQAVVALATQNTSLISVLGEVNTPNRFAAFPAGEHILDAITRAGGIKDQGCDTCVDLEREGNAPAAPSATGLRPAQQYLGAPERHDLRLPRAADFPRLRRIRPARSVRLRRLGRFRSPKPSARPAACSTCRPIPPPSILPPRAERWSRKLGVDISACHGPTVPVIYNVSFQDPAGYLAIGDGGGGHGEGCVCASFKYVLLASGRAPAPPPMSNG